MFSYMKLTQLGKLYKIISGKAGETPLCQIRNPLRKIELFTR